MIGNLATLPEVWACVGAALVVIAIVIGIVHVERYGPAEFDAQDRELLP